MEGVSMSEILIIFVKMVETILKTMNRINYSVRLKLKE